MRIAWPDLVALAPVVLLSLGACSHTKAHHGHRGKGANHANHRFENAEQWARVFEDPGRDEWQRPDVVIAALGLPSDAAVADLGAATGYFSVRLARALPQGVVFGLDIEPTMIEYLTKRAEQEKLANLHPILAARDGVKLPSKVDLVLIVDTYHHLENRAGYLSKLSEGIKPGGRIAIVDFRSASAMGPTEKLAPEVVAGELAQAHWKQLESITTLPEQYFLIFGRE